MNRRQNLRCTNNTRQQCRAGRMRADAPTNTVIFDATTNLCRALDIAKDTDVTAKTYSSEEACNVDAIENVYDAQMDKKDCGCSNSAGAVVTADAKYKGTKQCIADTTAQLPCLKIALATSNKAVADSNKAVADCKASKDHDKKNYKKNKYIIGGVAIALILIMGAVFLFTFRHLKHKLAVLEQQVPRSKPTSTTGSTGVSVQ